MKGVGEARGAVTIVNAIAAGKGCAVGIGLRTWAEVELSPGTGSQVTMEGLGHEPTDLASRCAQAVLERFSVKKRAIIRTESQIPVSRGLKSSSAAANAIILATLDALGESMDPLEILRMNAQVSIDSKVSVTGAMDDAAASLLGGVVFTDNLHRELLRREPWGRCGLVVIGVPERMIRKSGLPRDRIEVFRPLVDRAFRMAWEGDFYQAMCLNGLCYGAALGIDQEMAVQAMKAGALSAGISGTGPAVAAFVQKGDEAKVAGAMGANTMTVDVWEGEH